MIDKEIIVQDTAWFTLDNLVKCPITLQMQLEIQKNSSAPLNMTRTRHNMVTILLTEDHMSSTMEQCTKVNGLKMV